MAKIISIHSYRGGTGKSNLTANIAACLALGGGRVAVVDTDIQSPGIHMLFGLEDTRELRTLNDYLWERCDVQATAVDVTPEAPQRVPHSLSDRAPELVDQIESEAEQCPHQLDPRRDAPHSLNQLGGPRIKRSWRDTLP